MDSKHGFPFIGIVVFFVAFLLFSPRASWAESPKKILTKDALQLVGGFKIPRIERDGTRRVPKYLDILPGTNVWVAEDSRGYVVEMFESDDIGTGKANSWPELVLGREAGALKSVERISPSGVLWLDENRVLTSGRMNYRHGFNPNWIAEINLDTGSEKIFSVRSKSDDKYENFHVMMAFGGGFVRITDDKWAARYTDNIGYLLGRGGYDTLGSPLGPAMALWKKGEPIVERIFLDFPTDFPSRRDAEYTYPSLDPNSYNKAKLPIWKEPIQGEGFWQAGDVGGIAFIDHPTYKGFVVSHNHGRGVHDYRAQNDWGSGKFFLVADPSVFYSPNDGPDRGQHQQEVLNAEYEKGTYARVAQVYDPDDIGEIADGLRKPWEVESHRFDWPTGGLPWSEEGRDPTLMGSLTWDKSRELLWAVVGNWTEGYLVAYHLSSQLPNSPTGLKIVP